MASMDTVVNMTDAQIDGVATAGDPAVAAQGVAPKITEWEDRARKIPKYYQCCRIRCQTNTCGCIWHRRAKWNYHESWTCCNSCWAICLGLVFLIGFILMVTLIPDSFEVVGFGQRGIQYDIRSKKIEREVLGPDRYYVGFFGAMHIFTEHFIEIDFNKKHNTGITSRVKDGQQIELDVTLYYQLSSDTLLDLFDTFKLAYEPKIRSRALTTIRNVAATHNSSAFFHNRTLIESQIEAGLRSSLIGDNVVLAALYIRNVILPSRLDTQIKNIALQREEQNYQLSQLELEKIQATSNRTIIFLQTQKNSVLAGINLNTTNRELEIENLVQRQLEQTEQELSRLRSGRDRDVRVYQKETENMVEAITLNFTIVQEATKRMVTNINTETEAIVSVYDQTTENTRLELESQVITIQKEAERRVAQIAAETEESRARTVAALESQLFDLEEKLGIFLAQVDLDMEMAKSNAYIDSHNGMHPDLLVADRMSEATIGKVNYLDFETPKVVANFANSTSA